jgi:hypothetical protein
MILNPNKERVESVIKELKANDGYCPCMTYKNEDTKCPCKDKREKSICICELYVPETFTCEYCYDEFHIKDRSYYEGEALCENCYEQRRNEEE